MNRATHLLPVWVFSLVPLPASAAFGAGPPSPLVRVPLHGAIASSMAIVVDPGAAIWFQPITGIGDPKCGRNTLPSSSIPVRWQIPLIEGATDNVTVVAIRAT